MKHTSFEGAAVDQDQVSRCAVNSRLCRATRQEVIPNVNVLLGSIRPSDGSDRHQGLKRFKGLLCGTKRYFAAAAPMAGSYNQQLPMMSDLAKVTFLLIAAKKVAGGQFNVKEQ